MVKNPQIFRLMHQAHRALFRAADRALVIRFDITAAQHGVLLYLYENDGASMGAIAGALGLKNAATSGLIDRMQKKHLVDRQPSPLDGRSYIVNLLPYGQEVIKASKALITEANQKILEGYSPKELNKFASFLEALKMRADTFQHTENDKDTDVTCEG